MADAAKRKDSEGDLEMKEKGDPEEMAVDSRKDSAFAQDSEEIIEFARAHGRTLSDRNAYNFSREFQAVADSVRAEIQMEADRVYSSLGKGSPPRPYDNEMPSSYRRRMLNNIRHHSKDWRDADLRAMDGKTLKNVAKQVFADAYAVATNNDRYSEQGYLHERVERLPSGHTQRTYYGDPLAWMSQFSGNRQLAKFNLNGGNK